jgi:hypothetical protein
MEKIAHYDCLFVCEKIHEQIPIKNNISYSFCYIIIFMTNFCKLEMNSNQPLHYSNVHQFHNLMKVWDVIHL